MSDTNRKKVSTTVYLTPEQSERLKALTAKTRVVTAEYIREGIELVLAKYEQQQGLQPKGNS